MVLDRQAIVLWWVGKQLPDLGDQTRAATEESLMLEYPRRTA